MKKMGKNTNYSVDKIGKYENYIKNAKFLISVMDPTKLIISDNPEIAIAGKSNVGKSSFINFLTNQNKLARTSSEPGRTRMLNYFEINDGAFYLVDLPGYGYAKVSKAEKDHWGAMVEGYLEGSDELKHVFMLLDVRHEPTDDDKMLLYYLNHYLIDFTIVLTKSDKLSKLQINNMKKKIANSLMIGIDNIIVVSNVNKTGKDAIIERIIQVLEN